MRLTQFSDFAIRLLVFVASQAGRRATIAQAAEVHGISRSHLMKVASLLARHDFLKPSRGRMGGLALARPPGEITIGSILRVTEPDFALVGCMANTPCILTGNCGLPAILTDAVEAFLAKADEHTLAELVPGTIDGRTEVSQ